VRLPDGRAGADREALMTDSIRLGHAVPDFELEIYDPVKRDFGKLRLADLKSQGKWTILFFYPADFTFV
jgi:peroxiredoxin (alkyl hydroperoxide reductase subunit C)